MATKKKAAKPAAKPAVKKKTVKKAAPKPVKKAVKKPAKKAAPRPAKKTVKKPAVKKSTSARPKPVSASQLRPQVPEKDENIALERLSSPLIQDQKPGGSALKIVVPIILIIIIVAAAYLYFTQGKIGTKVDETAVEQAVEKTEIEKPVEKQEEMAAVRETEEPAAPSVDDGEYYTVKVKDQLNEISKELYGNYEDWKKIYELNKNKIGNPNLIFPGQKLKIPKNNFFISSREQGKRI